MTEEKDYRILVCGGRKWTNRVLTFGVLDGYLQQFHLRGKPIVIVEGGADGADTLAKEWAIKNDVPFEEYPADWSRYGRAAGPIRNQQMLDTGIDLVVAFPGGRGTADTIRRAEKMGIWARKPGLDEQYTDDFD